MYAPICTLANYTNILTLSPTYLPTLTYLLIQVLMELNVANNGIDEFGCFTLMAGLRENLSLRNIVLDGNPLGVQVRMRVEGWQCS